LIITVQAETQLTIRCSDRTLIIKDQRDAHGAVHKTSKFPLWSGASREYCAICRLTGIDTITQLAERWRNTITRPPVEQQPPVPDQWRFSDSVGAIIERGRNNIRIKIKKNATKITDESCSTEDEHQYPQAYLQLLRRGWHEKTGRQNDNRRHDWQ
jgi:hypothetical protein